MQQGMSVDQYFQLTGLSEDKIIDELKPQAEKRIKTRLVLEAVVAAEDIQVSDERLDENFRRWRIPIRWKLTNSKSSWAKMKRNR